MNINYLRLPELPRYEDGWQPVLDALRSGKFFTTTGEVLIPEFSIGGKQSGRTLSLTGDTKRVLEARLEWIFPLAFAEVISGDGQQVFRQRIDLADTESFGTRRLRLARAQGAHVGALRSMGHRGKWGVYPTCLDREQAMKGLGRAVVPITVRHVGAGADAP